MADCRLCKYFIPYHELDHDTSSLADKQARKRGEKPLGWCEYYNRVVTYYVGKCRAYRPKEDSPARKPLTDYIDIKIKW